MGEMHLPDGRVIGNRKYNSFYRQYYRPEDTRPSVQANREMLEDRLMNQIESYGGARGTNALTLSSYVKDYSRTAKRVIRVRNYPITTKLPHYYYILITSSSSLRYSRVYYPNSKPLLSL